MKEKNKMASAIKMQLIHEGTFTKTGIVEIDTFLEFVRKDICYVRENLSDSWQGYVIELADLAYGFIVMTMPSNEVPCRTYRKAELKELAYLEMNIYKKASMREEIIDFVPIIKPNDLIVRLEMLGVKEGCVLMNPSLQSAYELLSNIYLNPYPNALWQMADIIYCAQEYASTVFECIGIVGGGPMIESAEGWFMDQLERIQRNIRFYSKKRNERIIEMTRL